MLAKRLQQLFLQHARPMHGWVKVGERPEEKCFEMALLALPDMRTRAHTHTPAPHIPLLLIPPVLGHLYVHVAAPVRGSTSRVE